MKNIRAGALREPVFLGRPVILQDDAGGEALSWEELKTWAAIEPLSGREYTTGTTVGDNVDCRITVRISEGWEPDARWRVRHAVTDRLYNIVTPLLISKTGAAECLAKSAQGNADAR